MGEEEAEPPASGRVSASFIRTDLWCASWCSVKSSELCFSLFFPLIYPFSSLQKQSPISSGQFRCWLLDMPCNKSPPTLNLWLDTNFQLWISNNLKRQASIGRDWWQCQSFSRTPVCEMGRADCGKGLGTTRVHSYPLDSDRKCWDYHP